MLEDVLEIHVEIEYVEAIVPCAIKLLVEACAIETRDTRVT